MLGLFVDVLKSETFNYYEIKKIMIFDLQKEKSNFFKNLKSGESISYVSNNKEEHYFVDDFKKIEEKIIYFIEKNKPYKSDSCNYVLESNLSYFFPDLHNLIYYNNFSN